MQKPGDLLESVLNEKVYGLSCDENFCQVEWFAPIKKKAEDDENL